LDRSGASSEIPVAFGRLQRFTPHQWSPHTASEGLVELLTAQTFLRKMVPWTHWGCAGVGLLLSLQ
jgi:hypothetical protein